MNQEFKDNLDNLDELSRRQFVARTAKTALGVSVLPMAGASQQVIAAKGGGKAEHCIFFYMNGGMTHLDTFDPKPGAETAGNTNAIDTGVAGVKLSQYMPGLAKRFSDIAVVRSMTQRTGDHRGGSYWMHTSYEPRATIVHPTMGPWAAKLLGKKHKTLPDSVVIGGGGNHPGAGFFGPGLAPLPIGNPDTGVQNSALPKDVNEDQFKDRLKLMQSFDSNFRNKFKTNEVGDYNEFYDSTLDLMNSSDLDAFKLKNEPNYEKKVQTYGNTRVGKGAMLAKRLVSSGIRFVEVQSGGWDMHSNLWNAIPNNGGQLDQALSALIDDLKKEGLFEKTLIVLGTEFGRTPKINQNGGRDHHPRAFSTMFAGGGISGGQVYGQTDKLGVAVEENPVDPRDFNATIGHAMGINLNEVVYAPSGRPFLLAGHKRDRETDRIITQGNPIMDLFS